MLSKLPAVWTLNSLIAYRMAVPPAAALTVFLTLPSSVPKESPVRP